MVRCFSRALKSLHSIKIGRKGSSRLSVLAWLLFLICGIIYLAASIRDLDPLMTSGTVCFIIAVIMLFFQEIK